MKGQDGSPARWWPRLACAALVTLALAAPAAGCATRQVYSTSQHQAISLRAGDLDAHGDRAAALTPQPAASQSRGARNTS